MTLDSWLKFGHVLSAIVWLGGGLVLSLVGSRAERSDDPGAIREFARTLTYIGPRVMIPSVLGTIVFGIALVLTNAAWDFAQAWVLVGLAGFVVAFLIGAVYLSRVGIELGKVADGTASPDRNGRDLLGRWILGYRVVLIVLVVIVWDMIVKPGL
jgi:uncharacterized membrane protein